MKRALTAVVAVAVAALAARVAIGRIEGGAPEAVVAVVPDAAAVAAFSGEVLPSLRAVGMDGAAVPPGAYRGRLLVLNVWAPWCAPCRREMPSLARLHARLDPARFHVAALAADEDRVAVAEYASERALPFAVWATPDRSESLARLGVDRIPTTLIVAPDGRVLARVVGPREWDAPAIVAELEAMAVHPGLAGARSVGDRVLAGVGHDR
jgi:thiol-disulfide isomerase/thioredoxin